MFNQTILEIKNLTVSFKIENSRSKAVDNLSFKLYKGEVLGVVGESGSGKTVSALSILKLIPSPVGKIEAGEILFKDRDVLKMSDLDVQAVRGRDIAMIFQEPMTSLNPLLKIKTQMTEVLITHNNYSFKKALKISIDALKLLSIDNPEKRINEYPHSFSGGMRQRVMIAMALLANPSVLIADEPTTALDVTIQAEIFNQFKSLRENKKELGIVLITHNLALVIKNCDRLVIMYGGKIQEEALVKDFFKEPLHPYSKGLLNSLPSTKTDKNKLIPIPGSVPDIRNMPEGCKFWPRCSSVMSKCKIVEPELLTVSHNRSVRCHLFNE